MSSDRLTVTYAGEVYDRTRALYTGEVQPEGVDLRYLHIDIEELFWRQGRYAEFDTAEFSFGAYLASIDDPDRRFTAIPVFPSRTFRHAAIYVNTGKGIEKPEDLNGGRIGTPEWSMTASLWLRGILGEQYGLDLKGVKWRTGGLEQPGRQEKSRVTPPSGFSVEPIGEDATLNGLLVKGDLDAVISARPPTSFRDGNPNVRRLFANAAAEEKRYFQETGIFPVMHLVVVKRELAEQHPWLANNLRAAFEIARRPAVPKMMDTAVCLSSLVWESHYAEAEQQVMGDAFKYGAVENEVTLDALCRYAHEQGFSKRLLGLEDLFVPSTLTDAKI